jgi:hypothetical protein
VVGERHKRRWIQKERRAQHDPGEAVGVRRREAGNIAGKLRCNVRPAKPEMI